MEYDSISLIILLFLSGFFSSAETALFSISKAKITHLLKDASYTSKLIHKMRSKPSELLTVILIGNNVVNVGAASLATALAMKFFATNAISIATFVMTFLILIFGEIFPKSIAIRRNVLIARFTIIPIYFFSILLTPLVKILNFFLKITEKMKNPPMLTEEELITMIEVTEKEGQIKEEEKEFINNIFAFDDTSASEIMTPRADMFVIDINEKIDFDNVIQSGYSRFPITNGEIDQIIGIVHIKDIFKEKLKKEDFNIKKVIREAFFVPESKKLDSLLHQFKKRKEHMAIIVDEHGGVCGLITMEDILEELVGEIVDESDQDEKLILNLNKNSWVISGKAEIDYVNKNTDLKVPESPEYDTFSGYMLKEIGCIPQENEKVETKSFIATIRKKTGNRIDSFLVKKKLAN